MLENFLERWLYASRWLLAPIYVGLTLALLAIGIKFFQELFHFAQVLFGMHEADLVLVVLTFIDLALVASLLIMVILSGYENFVSRIEVAKAEASLDWLGKMDAGSLKQKVAASIVAISSIHLLKAFMNAQHTPNDKLMWYVIIHMTFVLSAFLMGYLDKIMKKPHQ